MKLKPSQAGFSLVEMIIVMMVMIILSVVAFTAFSTPRKYAPEDQAKRLVDIFDEARQKALNQRKTFRVEINKTKNEIRLIDEGTEIDPVVTDDRIIKTVPITGSVSLGVTPENIVGSPPSTSPIPVPTYASSNYPLSNGDQKITLRFRRNGRVNNAGNDNIGSGSTTTGATIYVTSNTPSSNSPDIIRAVTLLGTSGDSSVYKCQFDNYGRCGNWSR